MTQFHGAPDGHRLSCLSRGTSERAFSEGKPRLSLVSRTQTRTPTQTLCVLGLLALLVDFQSSRRSLKKSFVLANPCHFRENMPATERQLVGGDGKACKRTIQKNGHSGCA